MTIARLSLLGTYWVLLNAMLLTEAGLAADVDYFADNGFDNSLSTLQHPCAEYYNGKTYIAYQGPHEDAYVCAYDHAAQKWQGPVLAGVSPMGHAADPISRGEADNHGRPALIVDGQGYVHLIFGGHGGHFSLGKNLFGTPGQGKQTHVVTKNAEDISSWKTLDNVDPFGTYSQFVKMADRDIYLFYRHGSHRSDWVYQKSTDDCRSFAPPVSVLKHKAQKSDPNTHDAWYAWFTKGQGDTIVVMYVYHPCQVVGHNSRRSNAYYMKMNCSDESWENVSGRVLSVPVTKEDADEKTLVYDSGKARCNHGICAVDESGAPHLFFRYEKGQVRYTRWLGDAWQDPKPIAAAAGSQDGDMIVESPTEVRLLLEGGKQGGGGEVCWWRTKDGGKTWKKETCIISSNSVNYKLGSFVRNSNAQGQVVIEEHDPASPHLYRKLFLWGNKGLVGRSAEEAARMAEQLKNIVAAQPNDELGRTEQAERAARKRAKKAASNDE